MFFGKEKKRIRELSSALESASKRIAELERQNSETQAILESMVEGVIVLDRDSRIVSINPTITKIFEIKKENAQGRLFLDAIRNNDIAEVANLVLKGERFVSKEISLVWPVQRVFQINASLILENETVSGCLLVIHDITEIRKLEAVRRDFVANVSHELKTPLTSIKGFVETLLEGAIDDKENSRQFLEIIKLHAERLDNLVNDLLKLSEIESGQVKLDLSRVRLKELVADILATFNSQLKRKSLEFRNEIGETLSVEADRDKLRQVLVNLIDNAIKFNNEKGSVRIYSEGIGAKIKIIVEDSGIGIPPKDISRIFERFYRVDKARSRELGGTGLGLSIVKHIVELHGGNVGVESIEGAGSKFWFVL